MPAIRDSGSGSGSGVVSVDVRDLRTLGGTANRAAEQIAGVQRSAGGIIGGLDGRGWDLGAVTARWAGVRGKLSSLASDLGLQALDLQMRALWVDAFESGAGFGSVPGFPLQDPVNSVNGNLIHTEQDLVLPSRGGLPLALERTFNSRDSSTGVFGPRWSSNLDYRVEDCGEIGAIVRHASGRRDAFIRNDDGSYSGPMGVRDTLERQRAGWRLIGADGEIASFGASGRIQYIEDRNGNRLTFERDSLDRVARLVDAAERALTFEYERERLVAATDCTGRSWRYGYSDTENLIQATGPDGATTCYTYDENQRLETITDPLGRVVLTNVYDEVGRVLEQRAADGAVSRFAYTGEEAAGLTTTLTDPRGSSVRLQHDTRGLVTELVDSLGKKLSYTYTECGNRATLTDRAGHTWSYEYSGECRLASMTDPLGATTGFVYNEHGDLIERTDALGETWSWRYDERRNLVSTTSPLGSTRRFERDAFGQVVRLIDADGVETLCEYDDAGLQVRVRSAVGEQHFEYDAAGQLIAATDSTGGITGWEYDSAGRPSLLRDALGHATRWEYDAAGQLTAEVGPTGARTVAGYDQAGRLAVVLNALGGRRQFDYDINGSLTAYTDAAGHTTRLAYDELDRLTTVINPSGGTWRASYDPNGKLLELTDARGATSRNVFDAAGRLIEQIDRAGGRKRLELDPVGRIVAFTDPMGAETRYAYDADGRPVNRTDALGGRTELSWTPGGRLAAVVDAHGHHAELAYDSDGRLIGVRYANGTDARFSYDAAGNLVSSSLADGSTARRAYNALRQLISETNALGETVEFGYEERGALAEVRQAAGSVRTRFEFDPLGRIAAVVDALSNTTRYSYDARGLLTGVVDANGHSRAFAFDGSGGLVETVDALGRRTTFTNDPNGNCIGSEDPAGGHAQIEYDAVNRPVRIQTSDGQLLQAEYDAAGRWTTVRSGLGAHHRVYDAVGRLTRAVDVLDAATEYTYDIAGLPTRLTYPGGVDVDFVYDHSDRLTEIRDPQAGAIRLAYDLRGLPVSREAPSGARWETTHDALGRLTQARQITPAGVVANTFAYTYDDRNNILSAEENGQRTIYMYDALSRLIGVQGPHGESRFEYDAAGNRVCTQGPDGTQIRALYDAADQLQALQATDAGETRFRYDERGNLVERCGPDGEAVRYAWDGLDQLIGVESDTASRQFAYDGLGNLAREVRDGQTWTYTQEAGGRLARMLALSNGESSTRFVYGLSRVAAIEADSDNDLRFTGTDIRGSIRSLEDGTGATLARREYDAWGTPTSGPGAGPLGFTGEPQDAATKLVYLRARWYDPSIGRMLGRDPLPGTLAEPSSQNAYLYARDNPVSVLDPSGRSASSTVPLPAGAFPGAWPFGVPPIPGLGGPASIFGANGLPEPGEGGFNILGTPVWPISPYDIPSLLLNVPDASAETLLKPIEGYFKLADEASGAARDKLVAWQAFDEILKLPEDDPIFQLPGGQALRTFLNDAADVSLKEAQGAAAYARGLRTAAFALRDATPWAKTVAKSAPIAGALLDFSTAAIDQWNKDHGLSTPERVVRAAAKGSISATGAYWGARAGLAACAPADATVVGVLVDAGCGAVGGIAGKILAGPVSNLVNDIL